MHPVHGRRRKRRVPKPEAPSAYDDGAVEALRKARLSSTDPSVPVSGKPSPDRLGWNALTLEQPDPTAGDSDE